MSQAQSVVPVLGVVHERRSSMISMAEFLLEESKAEDQVRLLAAQMGQS